MPKCVEIQCETYHPWQFQHSTALAVSAQAENAAKEVSEVMANLSMANLSAAPTCFKMAR